MNRAIVESLGGITLVAGGPVTARDLALARRRAPIVSAADAGADRALALGVRPVAVFGDFDSIGAGARAALADVLHPVTEQETTDFDKALRNIAAPFVLALGVLGGRVDHELAALTALVGAATPVVAIGRQDVVFAAPARITLDLVAGDRLSLFPLAPVTGHSSGLDWPIAGLHFTPAGRIGTSNRVTSGRVAMTFGSPGMLVILPRARLDAALAGLMPGWRVPAVPPSAPGG